MAARKGRAAPKGGAGTTGASRAETRHKSTRYKQPLPRRAAFEQLDDRLDDEIRDALELTLDAALSVRELARCDYAEGQRLTTATLLTLLGAAATLANVGDLFQRLEGRRR